MAQFKAGKKREFALALTMQQGYGNEATYYYWFSEGLAYANKEAGYTQWMNRKAYPSDVSDDEWVFIAPYLTLMREDTPNGSTHCAFPPSCLLLR